MNKKRTQILHQIYRRIPELDCKGLCTDACSILGMAVGEAENLHKVSGQHPHLTLSNRCNYLKDGRCTTYHDRPAICRLFGVAEDMVCEFGCLPKRQLLTPAEGEKILKDVARVAGPEYFNASVEQIEEVVRKRKNGIL